MSKETRMVTPVDPNTGSELSEAQTQAVKDASPQRALEDADIAFDPTTQHLDLSKDEKRRTTALMMAIQAYQNIIIKDADYLREMDSISRREGTTIKPATMHAMVEAAIEFDWFIAGRFDNTLARHAATQSEDDGVTAEGAIPPADAE